MSRSFMVDKVAWHTSTKGNPESREETIERFRVFVSFLCRNGLLSTHSNVAQRHIDEDFEIVSEDLNELGMLVIKKGYDSWLKKIDSGMPSSDTSVLDKALDAVRSEAH
ncbi:MULTISPECIES: hypothetical protein [Mesorhizobium]|uniref:Uncharacterized protein n=1 Tax=Mesorhizobium denitrificans TaxID=2294114 RepID=A0A371XGI5_9HYPH|nr:MULTISPECIES: hypothetical protein [Mesorhizobium]RFC68345.1 hypothetical protein DY251_05015 [Mesorhizobium denitrificans]